LIDATITKSRIVIDPVQANVKNQIRLGNPTSIPSSVKPIEIDADLSGSKIELECGSIKECHSGLIIVDLHLQQKDSKGIAHTLNLKSRFGF
jgi:hypothetical protein